LPDAIGRRRLRRDQPASDSTSGVERLRCDHAIHEPDLPGTLGASPLAGEQHLHRRASAGPRGRAPTPGVEQNAPMFTPGVAKVAAIDATARSQVATS
jgi:hypothetical protein